MNIKWKDDHGNIFNADDSSIRYLDDGKKTQIKKEDVKKVNIHEGIISIYTDVDSSDAEIISIIPKGKERDAKKVYNNYDRTGKMLKGQSGNFLLDLILDSSLIMGNPLGGILAFVTGGSLAIIFLSKIFTAVFGNVGIEILRIILFGYIGYVAISYIFTFIKRKRLKEN